MRDSAGHCATSGRSLHLCMVWHLPAVAAAAGQLFPALHTFSLVKFAAGWRASRSSLSFVCVSNESMGYGD